MKKNIKKFFCTLMTGIMIVSSSAVALASTDTFWDSTTEYCSNVTTGTRVDLTVITSMDVTTTWYAFGQGVVSKGHSILKTKSSGKYSYVLSEHTITSKTRGIDVDIDFSSGSKISNSGGTAVYSLKVADWSYRVESDCISLTGYKEIHSGTYKVRDKNKKVVAGITVTSSVKYYW